MDPTTQPTGVTTPVLPNNFRGSATGEPIGTPTPPATTPDPPPAAKPETPPGEPKPAEAKPGGNGKPPMSDESLAARLDRAKRKAREDVLRELGVENADTIKAERAELAKLKAEREKVERDKMTREQQLAADLERERKARADLESKLREEQVGRVYEKQDSLIVQIATRHVDPSPIKMKTARREFAEYVETLPKSQVARMNERDIDRWFAKFVRDNPEFGPKPSTPAAPEPKKPAAPVKKPISTTTPAAKTSGAPAPASTSQDPTVNPQGKTFKPGQANSMTRAEVAAELKRRGMRGWR